MYQIIFVFIIDTKNAGWKFINFASLKITSDRVYLDFVSTFK